MKFYSLAFILPKGIIVKSQQFFRFFFHDKIKITTKGKKI